MQMIICKGCYLSNLPIMLELLYPRRKDGHNNHLLSVWQAYLPVMNGFILSREARCNGMKPVLKVFVIEHCATCDEARSIATRIEQNYPQVTVEVIDIGDTRVIVPETVFATPTFMLNNRIISLGNPYPDEIFKRLDEATITDHRCWD